MKYNPKEITGTGHRDIESLHPIVQAMAKQFLIDANAYVKELKWTVKIISTLRTWAEQDAIYAQGRTKPGVKVSNAKGGQSNHNWGVAFDIGIFNEKGEYNPKECLPWFDKLGPVGEKIGLDWGGRWNGLKDRPHYQFTGKYSNSDFLKLVNVDNLEEMLK